MDVTITAPIVPMFTALGPYCQNDAPALLPTTSNNGYTGSNIYYNYKNKTQDLSVQALVSLSNIRFYKNHSNGGVDNAIIFNSKKLSVLSQGV
jgi:hypothetical protein